MHVTVYRDAIRRSFLAKIAVWLAGQESRNLAEFGTLTYSNGQLVFDYINPRTDATTQYLIAQKRRGEQLSYPGVNIYFLDEVDESPGRRKNKRYLLPVKVITCRKLEDRWTPDAIEAQLLGIEAKILECISDGKVEIWDFVQDVNSPINTDIIGHWWFGNSYKFRDESLAIIGGDLRRSLTFNISYVDLSF